MIDAIPTPWSATHGNRMPFPVAFMWLQLRPNHKATSKNGFLSPVNDLTSSNRRIMGTRLRRARRGVPGFGHAGLLLPLTWTRLNTRRPRREHNDSCTRAAGLWSGPYVCTIPSGRIVCMYVQLRAFMYRLVLFVCMYVCMLVCMYVRLDDTYTFTRWYGTYIWS